jgi:quercetin dioxygenase-like cupin family protein
MDWLSLAVVAGKQVAQARAATSGRSAHTIHGGHDHVLRQTVLALAAGRGLDEHESPGEATMQVLVGRVRLSAGDESWEGAAGDYLVIPARRHSLDAVDDSAVLLTVVTATKS